MKTIKDIHSAVKFSQENPTLFLVAFFSNDGEKVKKSNTYNNRAQALFYAEKGNGRVLLNGEFID